MLMNDLFEGFSQQNLKNLCPWLKTEAKSLAIFYVSKFQSTILFRKK